MRIGASISLLLHLALILLFVFGLPNFFAPDELVEAIPVQVVTNISDQTTQTEMPAPEPPSPELPKPEPPKPAEPQPEPPPAPEPPKPEPPKPEPPAPQPAPEPTPAPEPEPVPEPVIAPPEPEPMPEPEPQEAEQAQVEPPPPAPPQKPKPPQVAEKPKEEPEEKPAPERDITSVLKNVEKLAQQSREEEPEPTQKPAPQTASQAPLGSELSASDQDAIANQIGQCWIVDVGMQGIEDIVVALNVQFNPDGSVYRIEFADPLQVAADPRYRVLAERARAAVQECSPIRVSSNYNSWKNLTFRFNPRGMLGL